MVIAVISIFVALLLGFGAAQEFIVRGIQGGELQPFVVGLAGIVVSLLLAASAIVTWARWAIARRLVLLAAVSLIVFHVYSALPPHRKVGVFAMIVGVG